MEGFQVIWVLLYDTFEVFPLLDDALVLCTAAALVAVDDEPIELLKQHLDLFFCAVIDLRIPLHH